MVGVAHIIRSGLSGRSKVSSYSAGSYTPHRPLRVCTEAQVLSGRTGGLGARRARGAARALACALSPARVRARAPRRLCAAKPCSGGRASVRACVRQCYGSSLMRRWPCRRCCRDQQNDKQTNKQTNLGQRHAARLLCTERSDFLAQLRTGAHARQQCSPGVSGTRAVLVLPPAGSARLR